MASELIRGLGGQLQGLPDSPPLLGDLPLLGGLVGLSPSQATQGENNEANRGYLDHGSPVLAGLLLGTEVDEALLLRGELVPALLDPFPGFGQVRSAQKGPLVPRVALPFGEQPSQSLAPEEELPVLLQPRPELFPAAEQRLVRYLQN